MSKLTSAVKPSDIRLDTHYFDTFGMCEMEVIARNIVVISSKNGDAWTPFSFEEYVQRCTHPGAKNEKGILDALAKKGYLSFEDGKYVVLDTFIGRLAPYYKEKSA